MRYYLAGPMAGIPQFNFPAFESATQRLREFGYAVISPHEQDSPAVQQAAWASTDGKFGDQIAGETWGSILSRDVRLVADEVNGIILLDDWWRSRGARLEVFVGLLCGHVFRRYNYFADDPLEFLEPAAVRVAMREYMP